MFEIVWHWNMKCYSPEQKWSAAAVAAAFDHELEMILKISNEEYAN